jgi:alkylation response protein AidB-like acyl-CoA dehydrogenase
MDFELSDDQVALRDAARDLLDHHASPARVRAIVDRGGAVDAKLWQAMAEQGWPVITVPESAGGVGLGYVEAAVLLEEVGAHVAPAPVLEAIVASDLVTGDEIVCLGWSGAREVVPYAADAATAVVVRDGSLVVGPAPAATVEAAMDVTRPLAWVDPAMVEGEVVGDAGAVSAYLDRGATAYAAELLGASQRMLDVTVQYAKDRVQFDKPIGSFQAVKHRCADMLVDVEGMRSAVYWAAWCIAAGHADASVAASTAKVWCSDAARRVMGSALQVHGGIGFTWECDVHLYLKRAQLDAMRFGDATFHRARLARLLRAKVEAGLSVL